MSAEHLIARLATGLTPVRRRTARGDLLLVGGLCGAEAVLFFMLAPMRRHFVMAMHGMPLWWKLVSLALIAGLGTVVTIRSLDPARSPRRGVRWLLALVAVVLLAGWGLDVAVGRAGPMAERLDWHDGLRCVAEMSLLSLPAMLGVGLLMRRGAPADTGATAVAAGLAAAAWGAFLFAFACPSDDPFYIAVWYLTGCGAMTGLARLVLPAVTRW